MIHHALLGLLRLVVDAHKRIPEFRLHRTGIDEVDADGLQVERQAARESVQAGRVARRLDPVGIRLLADEPRREYDGREGARGEVLAPDLGGQRGGEVADLAIGDEAFVGHVVELGGAEFVARGIDEVVEGADLGEEGLEVLLHGRLGQIAHVAGDGAVGEGGFESLHGGLDPGRIRRGDGHAGTCVQGAFCDGESDT